VLATALLLPAKEGGSGDRRGIVGARPYADGGADALAYIRRFEGQAVTVCAGTVVAPALVLTAAHCALDARTGRIDPAAGYKVLTGQAVTTSAPTKLSRVEHVLVYPGYWTQHKSDAALLVLAKPTDVQTIMLATSLSRHQAGGAPIAWMLGWDESYDRGLAAVFERYKRPERVAGRTVIQSTRWCQTYTRGFRGQDQICAIDHPADDTAACAGTSGGPLLGGSAIANAPQVGLVASSSAKCSTFHSTVFTRIDTIRPWIERQIEKYAP
jgi:secreted trypsin-like serine protease